MSILSLDLLLPSSVLHPYTDHIHIHYESFMKNTQCICLQWWYFFFENWGLFFAHPLVENHHRYRGVKWSQARIRTARSPRLFCDPQMTDRPGQAVPLTCNLQHKDKGNGLQLVVHALYTLRPTFYTPAHSLPTQCTHILGYSFTPSLHTSGHSLHTSGHTPQSLLLGEFITLRMRDLSVSLILFCSSFLDSHVLTSTRKTRCVRMWPRSP